MSKVRVLLADDQVLFVESLKTVIEQLAQDIEVVGIARPANARGPCSPADAAGIAAARSAGHGIPRIRRRAPSFSGARLSLGAAAAGARMPANGG